MKALLQAGLNGRVPVSSDKRSHISRTPIPYSEADFPFLIDVRSQRPEMVSSGPLHSHSESIEIQYIHCGNGQYFVGGRLYDLRPRTLCFIPAGAIHAYLRKDVPLALNKTSIICSPALLRELVPEQIFAQWLRSTKKPDRQHLVLSEKVAARIEQLLVMLAQEWSGKPPYYREAIRGYLRLFLIEVERARQEGVQMGDLDGHDALMDRLLTIIDAAFTKPLTLTDLAAQVHRSACHISHVFTKVKGITFSEYVSARRVVEARRLLETDKDKKVFAIAMESGFSTLSSFNRTFHRLVGMSPSSYRRLHNPPA